MSRKILLLVFIIITISSVLITKSIMSNSNLNALLNTNVEALAAVKCYSGGVGAQACSIEAGTEILGSGVSYGCSVSCYAGYYACCSIRCLCMLPMVPDMPDGM